MCLKRFVFILHILNDWALFLLERRERGKEKEGKKKREIERGREREREGERKREGEKKRGRERPIKEFKRE